MQQNDMYFGPCRYQKILCNVLFLLLYQLITKPLPLKLIQNHFHSFSFDQNAIIWVIQAREEAQVQVEDEAEVAINNMNGLVITAA